MSARPRPLSPSLPSSTTPRRRSPRGGGSSSSPGAEGAAGAGSARAAASPTNVGSTSTYAGPLVAYAAAPAALVRGGSGGWIGGSGGGSGSSGGRRGRRDSPGVSFSFDDDGGDSKSRTRRPPPSRAPSPHPSPLPLLVLVHFLLALLLAFASTVGSRHVADWILSTLPDVPPPVYVPRPPLATDDGSAAPSASPSWAPSPRAAPSRSAAPSSPTSNPAARPSRPPASPPPAGENGTTSTPTYAPTSTPSGRLSLLPPSRLPPSARTPWPTVAPPVASEPLEQHERRVVPTALPTPTALPADRPKLNLDLAVRLSSPNASWIVARALVRWKKVVRGGLRDVAVSEEMPRDSCADDDAGDDAAAPYPEVVDDVRVCVREERLDGFVPDGPDYMGHATVLYRRVGGDDDGTTVLGEMVLDSGNVRVMTNGGPDGEAALEDLVLHEFGHVLGVGGGWRYKGLVDASNHAYLGPRAGEIWTDDWGCAGFPPLEDDGGQGTRLWHWDDDCLPGEVGTGYGPWHGGISSLTVASLEDVGYAVDYDGVDAYGPGDVDPTCCRRGRSGGRGRRAAADAEARGSGRRAEGRALLSREGRVLAEERGRAVLDGRRIGAGVARGGGERRGMDGSVYVGDRSVRVLVRENGRIHAVDVGPGGEGDLLSRSAGYSLTP